MQSPTITAACAKKMGRKREQELLRQKRIFDEKWLKFGIDAEALEKQISEKKAQKQKQRILNAEMDRKMIDADKAAVASDHQKAQQRNRIAEEIDKFRMAHQDAATKKLLCGSIYKFELECDSCRTKIPRGDDRTVAIRVPSQESVATTTVRCSQCFATEPPARDDTIETHTMWDVLLREKSNEGFEFKPVASWKGYSDLQLQKFYNSQFEQAAEKKEHEAMEKERDLDMDKQIIEKGLEDLGKEIEDRKQWKMELQKIERFNKYLIDIQRRDQQKMKEEIYDVNAISDEFFENFGKSSR